MQIDKMQIQHTGYMYVLYRSIKKVNYDISENQVIRSLQRNTVHPRISKPLYLNARFIRNKVADYVILM